MSVNETTKLPDGRKCPAFALAVRSTNDNDTNDIDDTNRDNREENKDSHKYSTNNTKNKKKNGSKNRDEKCPHPCKEALLVIRGTSSTMDWSINMDEAGLPFTFSKGPLVSAADRDHTNPNPDTKTTPDPDLDSPPSPSPPPITGVGLVPSTSVSDSATDLKDDDVDAACDNIEKATVPEKQDKDEETPFPLPLPLPRPDHNQASVTG